MRIRATLLALGMCLVLASPALGQATLSEAASALRNSTVYVDPSAERALSESETAKLRRTIARERAGPMYVAVLPAAAAQEAGGDPGAALREVALSVGEPGTYAAVIGDSLRAGALGNVLPDGTAGALATEALDAKGGSGTLAVLEDLVRRVGDVRTGQASAESPGGDGGAGGSVGSGFLIFLVLLLVVPLGVVALNRRRRRREDAAALEQVKRAARDDLLALGQDIRALDLDVQMPDADEDAKRHYALAVERYDEAEQAFDAARRPQDMERVTSLLEEGRWAMTAAKARFAGEPVPERRPPCFFDPRHGPSVTDVQWAPPGGLSRSVPVCAADAARIEDGEEPAMRNVEVDGQLVPYWQAGPAFGPWAGGFFGGGLLPGFFMGSLLGSALGGFGMPHDAYAGDGAELGSGDFGDLGGGDFGGGSFGDFGGGDFGGGDF